MSQTLDLSGGNYVTTKAGTSAGTTTTLTTANTIQYAVNGKAYNKTAITNGATPTTDANTGALFALRPILANQGSVFLLALDASGNLVAAQGDIKALDVSGNFIDAPQLPTLSLSYTPFAYYVVKVGATGSAWTFGTSNNSGATGVTYAFVDVLSLPARPVVS